MNNGPYVYFQILVRILGSIQKNCRISKRSYNNIIRQDKSIFKIIKKTLFIRWLYLQFSTLHCPNVLIIMR